MMSSFPNPRRSLLVLGWLAACAGPIRTAEPVFNDADLAFFDKEVKPVLVANCLKCHGGENPKGLLRLTSRELVLKGGRNGAVVSLEKPEESRLLKALDYKTDALKMPPPGRLPQGEIDVLARWIKRGLPMKSLEVEAAALHQARAGQVTPEAKNYWAYKLVKRPEVPTVRHAQWVRNPIDAFILAKLEEKNLKPSAPADKTALVRRAYYDLIGLPPTPDQVDEFVNDKSDNAYEKLIDHLLKSPHYGEKWGRHWLDLVRYAETNGYERDGPKPFAWRFRDYVVKSFNDAKPFDRFLREQLAGDEIDRDHIEAIVATGFYRLGIWDDEPADPKQSRFDEFDDWVATTGQVFLGMTMNCARCHDHKIDPIPQADYYRLLAFFQDVQHFSDNRDVKSSFNISDISPPEVRKTYEQELKKREARKAEIVAEMTKIEDEAIKKMPAEDRAAAAANDRPAVVDKKVPEYLTPEQDREYKRLKRELNKLRLLPEMGRDLALSVNNCLTSPPETFVMVRGSPHNPGTKVEPGFPQVLGFADPRIAPPAKGAKTSERRKVLADWIASPENQLTSRVFVNRLWQHHFGRGIVASTNDFGKFGTLPTHPELLDWLASEFVKTGWKVKPMHKLIMMSNAYQMSVKATDDGLKLDPGNSLFWRFNPRRLTAEEVRDSFLAVSGKLDLKLGGPSVYPKLPKEVLAGQSRPGEGWPTSPPEVANRRSIYVHIKRSLQVPILGQHDQADTDSSCPVRYTTTVPTQALGLLNGEFANETAAAFAERLKKEASGLDEQVRRAIRLTTGREPKEDEVKRDVAFVVELRKNMSEGEALRKYCLLMLNANEFVYVD
jgi:Protein of unknown function (DUF1553)/Protein of unknown function (DUF1549)/Planctomycete cytochrome C